MTEDMIRQAGPYVVPLGFVLLAWSKIDRVYRHIGKNHPDNKLCEEKHKTVNEKLDTIQDDVKKLLRHSGCEE